MSRSKNNRSIPNMRGRRGEMKDKRLSHKRTRRMPITASAVELKRVKNKLILDRETKQANDA